MRLGVSYFVDRQVAARAALPRLEGHEAHASLSIMRAAIAAAPAVALSRYRPAAAWPSRLRAVRPPSLTNKQRGELLAMAAPFCTRCGGRGNLKGFPCACAFRRIFLACFREYDLRFEAADWPNSSSPVFDAPRIFNSRAARFRADFDLVLSHLPALTRQVLNLHFKHHLNYREIIEPQDGRPPLVNLSKGKFFHTLYRGMAKAGAAMHKQGLFPIYEY